MLSNAEICLHLHLTEHAFFNIFTLSLLINSSFYIQIGGLCLNFGRLWGDEIEYLFDLILVHY